MTNYFLVSEDILIWAFRYALGRRTGAVDSAINCLKKHWEKLTPFTQDGIHHEIRHAIGLGSAGGDYDIKRWKELLRLKINKNES